jgi:hypothetical protein
MRSVIQADEAMPDDSASRRRFVLFLDVMGVSSALLPETDDIAQAQANQVVWGDRLYFFRTNLHGVVNRRLPAIPWRGGVWRCERPLFVAEFSDCAYLVFEHFPDAAFCGGLLMRCAYTRGVPMRAGLAAGAFLHQWSGVTAAPGEPTWSTASFLGSGAVLAYQAERSPAKGFRILIHPSVLACQNERHLDKLAIRLPAAEVSPHATHEVPIVGPTERAWALRMLKQMQEFLRPPDRALPHYTRTRSALLRMCKRNHCPLEGTNSVVRPMEGAG